MRNKKGQFIKGHTYKHSIESKNRMSISKMGQKNPSKREDVRKKMSESRIFGLANGTIKPSRGMLGKKHSEKTKTKMSESRIGRPSNIGMTGKKQTEITRRKISYAHKKKFIGIISKRTKYKIIRQSFEYKLWREAVFIRDNWTCRFCSNRGGKLQADHIKPFALFPELRLSIDNGRTLCEECHKKTDSYLNNKIKL